MIRSNIAMRKCKSLKSIWDNDMFIKCSKPYPENNDETSQNPPQSPPQTLLQTPPQTDEKRTGDKS